MLLLDMCRALRCLDEPGEPVQTEGGIFVCKYHSFVFLLASCDYKPDLV
jgi:hypothetical protein